MLNTEEFTWWTYVVMRYTVSLRASQNIIFFDTYCFPDIYIIYIILYILNYLN